MNMILLVIILGFGTGAILGSLVKALSDRSLTKRSFLGRSYCQSCKHKLGWYDLLPILSYILLRGKCRYCGHRISLEYLLVEVGMGILVGILFLQALRNFQFTIFNFHSIFNLQFSIFILDLIFKTFFVTVLAILFLTDFKKMLIPDRIVKPAIVISIIFIMFITVIKVIFLYYSLSQTRIGQLLLPPHGDYFTRHAVMVAEPFFYAVLSAIFIGGFFWLLILITKGKGMGGGDVKLGAFIGLGLGFPHSFLGVMLSFLIGAFWGLGAIILGKKKMGQQIAFGPFLVIGAIITLFWGKEILNWYLHLSPK